MLEQVKEKLQILPDKPGCYLMKNRFGKIIYVGKAKNLKNRVKSYFTGAHNTKTTKLVSEIDDFDFVITSNEVESLVLELNLIKEHDPRYNILLKDDKTYPYIVLTKEKFPRLVVMRNFDKKRVGLIFGPYPNVTSARKTCDLLNQLYPLRKCKNLPKKECLYFHIHQCLAPCIYKQDFDYTEYKQDIINFLNGEPKIVLMQLEEKMNVASLALDFEKAMEYRDLIEDVKITTQKQIITSNDLVNKDVFGISYDEDQISVHVLYIRNGSIVNNYQKTFSYIGDYLESFTSFLLQFYDNKSLIPKEVIINDCSDVEQIKDLLQTSIIIPKKGRKKELLDLANMNAKKDLENKQTIHENRVLKKIETVENLGALLNIPPPYHIEAFDNSNIFGEFPVSAMVVYKDGKPSKKDYRKYHVKTVEGPNDYATMKEVIYRRYYKLLMDNEVMPDLIIMDGGQIQVNACLEILESLGLKIHVCGIKKDKNHKASLLVFNNQEISISKNSDIFLLLANISLAVHEFAISFFRTTKAKGLFSSRLDGIKNLGPKRKEKIIKHFVTIDNIKKAAIEDFASIQISSELAQTILDHLNKE